METAYACPARLLEAIVDARRALEDEVAEPALAAAAEAAQLVGALLEEQTLTIAVLAQRALAGGMSTERLDRRLGEPVRRAAQALQRLGALDLGRSAPGATVNAAHSEALRKMLLAVASDPRQVAAHLAIVLVGLRGAKQAPEAERRGRAEVTRSVFAPLANRLGLWPLKWELEDLAFRYLEPAEYKRVATALAEKRADRERYITELCGLLERELAQIGIAAQVQGRPKHLYSIYRKMHRKSLAFGEVFDVRAVRVLVATVADCYAALGLVHSRWAYVPGEFDNYIATPKANAYRSIHTAVIGPGGKAVEIQIRTHEMHSHSELGVAAHWRYKEGAARDALYEHKIEWARRLLQPPETMRAAAGDATDPDTAGAAGAMRAAEDETRTDFIDRLQAQLFADRVYALTPKGEVIDLVGGATPLDFAYQVHTDLGHRTRGAKVDGRIVPLNRRLANGEVVEIITHKNAAPSRDWLSRGAAVLASPRSRAKVRAWFRRQNEAAQTPADAGTTPAPARPEVPAARPERAAPVTPLRPLAPSAAPVRRRARRAGLLPVTIEGLDDLPITLARCCLPVRPQPIAGYVTVGRGVTVHRAQCAGFARMRAAHPERALAARWTDDESSLLAVEVTVDAFDRRGLVRDLTDVLASERLSIESLSTSTQHAAGTARAVLRFGVPHLELLARIERRLRTVSAVTAVRRSG